jgi:hypothetical protein
MGTWFSNTVHAAVKVIAANVDLHKVSKLPDYSVEAFMNILTQLCHVESNGNHANPSDK